eukprot:2752079-Pyramimonas_sp.AAC.1
MMLLLVDGVRNTSRRASFKYSLTAVMDTKTPNKDAESRLFALLLQHYREPPPQMLTLPPHSYPLPLPPITLTPPLRPPYAPILSPPPLLSPSSPTTGG